MSDGDSRIQKGILPGVEWKLRKDELRVEVSQGDFRFAKAKFIKFKVSFVQLHLHKYIMKTLADFKHQVDLE